MPGGLAVGALTTIAQEVAGGGSIGQGVRLLCHRSGERELQELAQTLIPAFRLGLMSVLKADLRYEIPLGVFS